MDFIEGLPKAYGKNVIMVAVDRLTKYAHFMALSHPFTAKDIAEIFMEEVVKLQLIAVSSSYLFLSAFVISIIQNFTKGH